MMLEVINIAVTIVKLIVKLTALKQKQGQLVNNTNK